MYCIVCKELWRSHKTWERVKARLLLDKAGGIVRNV
jgi:hypothetical protein